MPKQKNQNELDKLDSIKKIDRSEMAKYIDQLPHQIKKALSEIKKINLPRFYRQIKNIALCGMGGSAIAGHLIVNLPAKDRKIPIKVIRDYNIPAWVDKNTLVVLTSHSGQTKETLSAFKNALAKKAKIFIAGERGKLEKLGYTKTNAIVFDYDTPAPPRASLGYQFGAIFGLLKQLKIINYNIQPALILLKKLNNEFSPKVKAKNNLAKKLAQSCFNHLPIIIAAGVLKSVAWRWKTQFNENSKNFAFTEFLPEAMHNAIQGFELPKQLKNAFIYLILQNSFDPPELVEQLSKFEKILINKKIKRQIIKAWGKDVFSQKLSILLLGDWLSFYLAILNKVDPTPVETIKKSK